MLTAFFSILHSVSSNISYLYFRVNQCRSSISLPGWKIQHFLFFLCFEHRKTNRADQTERDWQESDCPNWNLKPKFSNVLIPSNLQLMEIIKHRNVTVFTQQHLCVKTMWEKCKTCLLLFFISSKIANLMVLTHSTRTDTVNTNIYWKVTWTYP